MREMKTWKDEESKKQATTAIVDYYLRFKQ